MPFGRVTHVVPGNIVLGSNIVLGRGPDFTTGRGEVWGQYPQFTAMPLIARLLLAQSWKVM